MSLQLNTTQQPVIVSPSQLRFTPANVGDEQFLLLKISQEHSSTPVRVVSEDGAIQVAVQGSPLRFSTDITFTPVTGGTFVHVRFAPKQAGRYNAELRLETEYDTQIIPVLGRATGWLSGVDRSLKIGVVLVLLGGGALAYLGFSNRAAGPALPSRSPQVAPKLSASPKPVQAKTDRIAATEPTVQLVTPAAEIEIKKTPRVAPRAATPPVERELTPPETSTVPPESQQPATEQPANPATEPIRATASRLVPPRAPVLKVAKKKAPPAKPKPAETPGAESDLEKELNKNQ